MNGLRLSFDVRQQTVCHGSYTSVMRTGHRMPGIGIGIAVLVLTTGCASSTSVRESWQYVGPDTSLKFPEPVSASKQSLDAQQIAFNAWRQRALAAIAVARDQCANETGESVESGFLRGFSETALACMRSHGWSRATSGNPL